MIRIGTPSCGTTKPAASQRLRGEERRTYVWVVVVGIVGLIVWSAVGTGTDLRVLWRADAWLHIGRFRAGLFPPDLSSLDPSAHDPGGSQVTCVDYLSAWVRSLLR